MHTVQINIFVNLICSKKVWTYTTPIPKNLRHCVLQIICKSLHSVFILQLFTFYTACQLFWNWGCMCSNYSAQLFLYYRATSSALLWLVNVDDSVWMNLLCSKNLDNLADLCRFHLLCAVLDNALMSTLVTQAWFSNTEWFSIMVVYPEHPC